MAGAGQEEEKVEHEGEEMVAGRQQGSSRGAVEQCGGQAQPAVTAPCSSKVRTSSSLSLHCTHHGRAWVS
jgi:hypothetical protein